MNVLTPCNGSEVKLIFFPFFLKVEFFLFSETKKFTCTAMGLISHGHPFRVHIGRRMSLATTNDDERARYKAVTFHLTEMRKAKSANPE